MPCLPLCCLILPFNDTFSPGTEDTNFCSFPSGSLNFFYNIMNFRWRKALILFYLVLRNILFELTDNSVTKLGAKCWAMNLGGCSFYSQSWYPHLLPINLLIWIIQNTRPYSPIILKILKQSSKKDLCWTHDVLHCRFVHTFIPILLNPIVLVSWKHVLVCYLLL